MKKIRVTENQASMILQREKDLTKKKVLKINEGQYTRIFQNEGIFERGDFDSHIQETETEEIDPLTFAQQLIIFVRDIITRKARPFSNYWRDLGITRAQLLKMLKDNEVLELVMDEGRGKNIIKAKKTGFRRAIKTIYKDVVASRDTIEEVRTPDTGWTTGDDPRDEPIWDDPIEIPKDKRRFKMIGYYDEADNLALFNDANKQLYAISAEHMGDDKDEVLNPYSDSDLELGYPVDSDTIFRYVNDTYMNIPLERISSEMSDFTIGSLVRVNQALRQEIINAYEDDEDLVHTLNSAQLPESTGASSSGAFVDGASFAGPIQKDKGDTPGESMRNISEPVVITEPDFIEDPEEEVRETTVAGASADGGSSGPFDVNAFGDSAFMKAGNKLNKEETMPMVKRSIGESYKVGQIYKNGYGRAKILSVTPDTLEVSLRDGNGTKVLNIEPHQLGGWELFLEGKKVLKVTEAQMKKIMESNNSTSTAYPGGGFVEIDDCTKLDNNTVAQDGGCSQGAVDNVVKAVKTKDSVVAKG